MSSLLISELTNTALYFSGILFGFSAFLLLALFIYRWKSDFISLIIWMVAHLGAAWLAWLITRDSFAVLIVLGVNAILFGGLYQFIPVISIFGLFFLISMLDPALYGLFWLFSLIWSLKAALAWPLFTAVLMIGIFVGLLIFINTAIACWTILIKFSQLYFHFPRKKAGWEAVNKVKNFHPFVSIHVPCYAEPPEMVIKTLKALAAMQYPHFEVIVLDNNTHNSNLWKPLEEYCLLLGNSFRFFHFEGLQGAKAGALNAALRLTDPQAEVIAVIDADFIVQPDFLEQLIGFFANPQTAFVQSCQDYREWEKSRYQSACYFEYVMHFKLELPGANEWDMAYTVGTMCLIRRHALEEVGGWAEWCLTEDSEVSIRLHARGYKGYYLKETFGRGLIPETFEAYKKQRFRWIAGPVQQFQKHWRLYLPWLDPSYLSGAQKLGELAHSLSLLFSDALNLLINLPLLLICLWFAIGQQKSFILPMSVLFLIPIALIRNSLCNWIYIRLLGGRWRDYFYSALAERALNYTKYKAFYTAWFKTNLEWKRTDKFKMTSNFWRAYNSSRSELIAGFVYILIAFSLLPFAHYAQPDIICLALLGVINQIFTFFCAPIMAFLCEQDLSRKNHSVIVEGIPFSSVQTGALIKVQTKQEKEIL